jgi:uridine kinase
MELLQPVTFNPKRLNVIEGAYSMHPQLEGYYDLSVFIDISKNLQKERIKKRNGKQMAQRFFEEWIPLENTYFEQTKAKERCDIIIEIE